MFPRGGFSSGSTDAALPYQTAPRGMTAARVFGRRQCCQGSVLITRKGRRIVTELPKVSWPQLKQDHP